MPRWGLPLLFLLLSISISAGAQWSATATQKLDLLDDDYAVVGSIAAGSALDVILCVRDGAICEVKVDGKARSVDGGKLMTTFDGRRMTVTEAEKAYRGEAGTTSTKGAPADVIAWGDSLTAGAGSGGMGKDYPAAAALLFPNYRDVVNAGIGGQTSTSIAARMNALPTLLTFEGNQLPASEIAIVTDRTLTPITNQGPSALAGTVCGVHGTLSASTADEGKTYRYAFQREQAGQPVACPARSAFLFDLPEQTRGRLAWLWLGRNGAGSGHTVAADIAAAVAALEGAPYLVGSILTGANDGANGVKSIGALNASLAATYGDRYVDVLGALLASGDGSAEDAADVAAGVTPRSLRSDPLHLNAKGYAVAAKAFVDATLKLGL